MIRNSAVLGSAPTGHQFLGDAFPQAEAHKR